MNETRIINIGFLEKLSYDIISNIFLYLDQQDCMNCMVTCRDWYNRIPQFTQDNWKTLELCKSSINQCQERNFGKHIKHVLFDGVTEDLLAKMMQKLIACECTGIESLEFIGCVSGSTEEQQNLFLNLLRQLASHRLIHLNMKYHNWNFSIIDILSVCPHLTHFSYHAGVYSNPCNHDYKSIKLLPNDETSYNALIYLHVDSESPIIKGHVQSIVCRSPNLRYLIGASTYSCRRGHEISIPPEFVLENCPKLEYYAGDGSYEPGEEIIQEALKKSSSATNNYNISCTRSNDQLRQQQSPFHHLAVRSNWKLDQIIFLLKKYKDTLKHFRLRQTAWADNEEPFDWTHTFQTTPMEQLRTLYCANINCSMESIIDLLNTCRNTIQEVQIQHLGNKTLDVPTLQSLQTLPQLRILSLQFIEFVDESSVIALLERLPLLEKLILEQNKQLVLPEQAAPLLKNLKHLTLVDTSTSLAGATQFGRPSLASPALFVSLSQYGSKLKSVTLKPARDAGIPFLVLQSLTALRPLKALYVYGIDRCFDRKLNEENEEEYMLQFFNGFLHGHDNDIMNNKIATSSLSSTATAAIEDLTLPCIYKLTYTMLNALGDLTSLRNICISLITKTYLDKNELFLTSEDACVNLDLCGVLELLRKGRKLKRIAFRGVISSGNFIPSDYLKKKLIEQQQNNFQLRKYIVKSIYRRRLIKTRSLFENRIEIINTHYNQ